MPRPELQLVFVLCFGACALAQNGPLLHESVPHPEPGYGLYYHDPDQSPDVAARWGYYDGWSDGRHDRNHGDSFSPEDKEHYQLPPEHTRPEAMTWDSYVREYRQAYARGYKHGSRI